MRHVPDGTLRRLVDEPFAITERHRSHIVQCDRCRSRAFTIASNESEVRQYFSPVGLASPEAGWRRLLDTAPETSATREVRVRNHRRWKLMGASLSTSTSIAVAGLLIAGVAAAATLTTVFAPTQVTPLPVTRTDVQQLASFVGLGSGNVLGGFQSLSGTKALSYGTLHWSASGTARQVPTLAAAESEAGFDVTLPSSLPNGIDGISSYREAPSVTASITFNANAGNNLSGSTLVMSAGPAVEVSYSGGNSLNESELPPLAVIAMPQLKATSTGATTSQLVDFLLAQPGVPADLAHEIRLIGNLGNTLLVPTPPGANSTTVSVDGSTGVIVRDNDNTASGAIWVDKQRVMHLVAGLLDSQDLLNVAQQIG